MEALADGSLLNSNGQPLVFVHRKLLERKLQSYASDHALAISLSTILSFMALKIGGCRHFCSLPPCRPACRASLSTQARPPHARLSTESNSVQRASSRAASWPGECSLASGFALEGWNWYGQGSPWCPCSHVRLLAGEKGVEGPQAADDGRRCRETGPDRLGD